MKQSSIYFNIRNYQNHFLLTLIEQKIFIYYWNISFAISDNDELLSLPSVSPERPNYDRFETPTPATESDLSIQQQSTPSHSSPSTPDSQTPVLKRIRSDTDEMYPLEGTPSGSNPQQSTPVQQSIL